jgi:DNA polymerase elongation subunit (family B)
MNIAVPSYDDYNGWADHYFYAWGVNVIPAPTIDKGKDQKDKVSSWIKGGWDNYQTNTMTFEEHEEFKRNGDYTSRKGLAIIAGQVWRGPHKGLWLTFIDCDNELAIDCILGMFRYDSLEVMSKDFVVEQHKEDAPNKAHIYLYSKVPFSQLPSLASKGNSKFGEKIKDNTMPGLEIKSEKSGLAFACPSFHAGGQRYEIMQGGTAIPKRVLEEDEVAEIESKIEEIFIEFGISYVNNDGKIPMTTLFNSSFKIKAGNNRHNAVLRVAMHYLLRLKDEAEAFEKTKEWNNQHCEPPLSEDKYIDITRTFEWAKKYVARIEEKQKEEKESKETKHERAISTATQLVEGQDVFWFKDEYHTAYVRIKIDNHYEVMHVDKKSRIFRLYITKLYYDFTGSETLKTDELLEIIRACEAKAMFSGNVRKLHLRKAWLVKDIDPTTFEETVDRNVCFYDTGSPYWTCIMVDGCSNTWNLLPHHPDNVLFFRYQQKSQVIPKHKGEYDEDILDQWLTKMHIKNENDRLVFKVWIITLFVPEEPNPLLIPHGAPGGAKSTLCEQIGNTFDPYAGKPLMLPTKMEEVAQHAHHRALLIYDNIDYEIPKWLSNLLCQLITGANVSKRQLFTDDSDFAYVLMRSVILNGLDTPKLKADAMDRTIKLHFDRISDEERKRLSEINDWFKGKLPQILGKIFDTLALSLQIYPTVKLDKLPRMADFAVRGVSIARALATEDTTSDKMQARFLEAYKEITERQNIDVVEGEVIASALIKWHNEYLKKGKESEYSKTYEKEKKIGFSPGALLVKLTLKGPQMGFNVNDKDWPKKPNAFTKALRLVAQDIRSGFGIDVHIFRDTRGQHTTKNSTWIEISEVNQDNNKAIAARTDNSTTPPDNNNCFEEKNTNNSKTISTIPTTSTESKLSTKNDENSGDTQNSTSINTSTISTELGLVSPETKPDNDGRFGGDSGDRFLGISTKNARNHAQILIGGGSGDSGDGFDNSTLFSSENSNSSQLVSLLPDIKANSVAIDLEWDNRPGADDRLIQFNLRDWTGKKWVINVDRDCNGSEDALLETAEDTIRNYKIVFTWFEKGDYLGFGVWNKRALALGRNSPVAMGFREDGKDSQIDLVNKNNEQIIDIDIGQVYEKESVQNFFENIYISNELDEVSNAILGRGKVKGINKERIAGESLEKLIEYGMEDADLTYELATAKDCLILRILEEVGKIVGLDLEKMCHSTPEVWADSLYRNRMHLTPPENLIRKTQKYKGAFVTDVEKPGEYTNVAIFDFKGQYPEIIKYSGISFEKTAICTHEECRQTNKIITGQPDIDAREYWNCLHIKKGVLPTVIEYLVSKRDSYKKLKTQAEKEGNTELTTHHNILQQSYKITGNILYGVNGSYSFSFGSLPCAEIITAFARTKTNKANKKIETEFEGLKVVYNDTDSSFVQNIQGVINKDNPTIQKILQVCNAPEDEDGLGIPIEYKKCYSKVLIWKSKNYMGINADTKKVEVVGLTGKKRNNCKFVRDVFEQQRELWKEDSSREVVEQHIKSVVWDLENKVIPVDNLKEKSTLHQDPFTGYQSKNSLKEPEKVIGTQENKKKGETVTYWHRVRKNDKDGYYFTKNPAEIDYNHYKEPLKTALIPILTVRGYTEDQIDTLLNIAPKIPAKRRRKTNDKEVSEE